MREVIVVGDAILDRTTHVRVRGPSPEFAHVLVVNEDLITHNLGGACNVAAGVKALGAEVTYLGARVIDADGALLEGLLRDDGIRYRFATTFGGHTSVKNRVVAPSGQILRIDRERHGQINPFGGGVLGLLGNEVKVYAGGVVGCLVDYGKGVFSPDTAEQAVGLLGGNPILVEPGTGDWGRFDSPTTLFKVNFDQAVRHYQAAASRVSLLKPPQAGNFDPCRPQPTGLCEEVCKRVEHNLHVLGIRHRYLVVTLGASGLVLYSGGRALFFREDPVPVVDPCGAGDTVMAALAFAVARFGYEEPDLVAGCRLAVRAAALAVQRRGVSVIRRDEVSVTD